MVVTHERVLSLSLSSLFLLFFFETSIHTLHTSTLSLFFFLSTPDSHIEVLERAQKRLEKEREVSFDNPLLRERMRNIFVATKNAHVFASSSSFGFGCTNLFQKSKERKKTPPQRRRRRREREREKRERERGKEEEEEEEDVLRLFVFFFSEFLRGVVFVSRVESQRG